MDGRAREADGAEGNEGAGAAVLTRGATLAYGALGLPLAFAALPLYVHVPQRYAGDLGLSLATVGVVLLAVRIVDALTDPLIGWASDRLARRALIALALPLLGGGMFGLLAPPAGAGALWLAALATVVSLGYSLATIAHHAWGAEVAPDAGARTRLVASREAFALVGVVLAAALPAVLAGGGEVGSGAGLARLAALFVPVLAVCAALTLWRAPPPPRQRSGGPGVVRGLGAALACRPFARLLAVFAANGIAAAIPSATVLFFVADVLGAAPWSGLFLVLYFVAAAASLAGWVRLARHLGKLRAWLVGMGLAVAAFVWAGLLGSGDVLAFGLICVLSGIALGADLVLPPALVADLLAAPATSRVLRAGACFGWWNFVAKANLALAAGLALPLLAWLGYVPGAQGADALRALAAVYAFVPVLLKLGACALAWHWRGALEVAAPAAAAQRISLYDSRGGEHS